MTPGLYQLASRDIFELIARVKRGSQPGLHMWVSYYEIYCSHLFDLLNKRKKFVLNLNYPDGPFLFASKHIMYVSAQIACAREQPGQSVHRRFDGDGSDVNERLGGGGSIRQRGEKRWRVWC